MTVTVRRALDGDFDAIAAVLWDVQQDSDGAYPPRHLASTPAAVREWLERYPMMERFVAVDEEARLVGHAGVVAPEDTDPDIPAWFTDHGGLIRPDDILELSRLFVAPAARGRGVGTMLLDAATRAITGHGRRPALCVLDTQGAARDLYRREGWTEVGSFVGVSGIVNHVVVAPKPSSQGGASPPPRHEEDGHR